VPRRNRAVPPWVVITIVGSSGLIASLHFTLVLPLLADLPGILSISSTDASWLITATLVTAALVTAAVSTPIVSRMADMYGKPRMLIVTLAVTTVGSVTCAVMDAFPAVLAGRAMQGFASSLIAVGIRILRDQLPKERVATAVALMSARWASAPRWACRSPASSTTTWAGTPSSGSAPSPVRC
jgi:MFS family permease